MSDDITARITGNDYNQSTQTGTDYSNQPQHTFPTAPNTYAPQPNAPVHIAWGVMTKLNTLIIERFFCDTTLANYSTDVSSAATVVYQYVYSQQALPADVEVHWSIRIANVTAPPMSMGGVPLSKQTLDGHLTSLNIGSQDDLQNPILQAIPFMQKVAKY